VTSGGQQEAIVHIGRADDLCGLIDLASIRGSHLAAPVHHPVADTLSEALPNSSFASGSVSQIGCAHNCRNHADRPAVD